MKKLLIIPALLTSSFVFADIPIIAPTQYDNGDSLALGDIARYDICIASSADDVCDSEIQVIGDTIDSDLIPDGTHHIKARTVTIRGEVGDYGDMFVDAFRKPLAPGLTIKITIEVNQ